MTALAILILLVAIWLAVNAVWWMADWADANPIPATATGTCTPDVQAVTSTPTRTPTRTPIPTSRYKPTPSPAPTRTPVPTPTDVVRATDLSSDDIAILASLVRAEAGGMHTDAQYLVACNILAGNNPRQPISEDFAIANGAADGDICREYPHCRFLGNIGDVHAWQANDWIKPGRYDLWLGPGGQMLVCVPHAIPLGK